MTLPAEPHAGLALPGLDGSNPLAFLAALGTLRTLSLADGSPVAPDWLRAGIAMNWVLAGVVWTPILYFLGNAPPDPDAFLEALVGSLIQDVRQHPLFALESKDDLRGKITACVRGSTAQNRQAEADWLSALCSDLAPEATSQLQTVRRDYFFRNLESIMANVTNAHLRRAIFAPWDFADPLDNQSLHIEPTEDRRHAYQWHRPSGDPTRAKRGGMLGANRLAIEAFPLFQSFAVGDRLSTTGFTGQRANNTRWTWPIWSCRLGLREIPSLLGLAELQAENPDAPGLRARGVPAAFRCRRILVEKTPNFTPATAVF